MNFWSAVALCIVVCVAVLTCWRFAEIAWDRHKHAARLRRLRKPLTIRDLLEAVTEEGHPLCVTSLGKPIESSQTMTSVRLGNDLVELVFTRFDQGETVATELNGEQVLISRDTEEVTGGNTYQINESGFPQIKTTTTTVNVIRIKVFKEKWIDSTAVTPVRHDNRHPQTRFIDEGTKESHDTIALIEKCYGATLGY